MAFLPSLSVLRTASTIANGRRRPEVVPDRRPRTSITPSIPLDGLSRHVALAAALALGPWGGRGSISPRSQSLCVRKRTDGAWWAIIGSGISESPEARDGGPGSIPRRVFRLFGRPRRAPECRPSALDGRTAPAGRGAAIRQDRSRRPQRSGGSRMTIHSPLRFGRRTFVGSGLAWVLSSIAAGAQSAGRDADGRAAARGGATSGSAKLRRRQAAGTDRARARRAGRDAAVAAGDSRARRGAS